MIAELGQLGYLVSVQPAAAGKGFEALGFCRSDWQRDLKAHADTEANAIRALWAMARASASAEADGEKNAAARRTGPMDERRGTRDSFNLGPLPDDQTRLDLPTEVTPAEAAAGFVLAEISSLGAGIGERADGAPIIAAIRPVIDDNRVLKVRGAGGAIGYIHRQRHPETIQATPDVLRWRSVSLVHADMESVITAAMEAAAAPRP